MFFIETERLYLRQWSDDDLPIWIEMNADPEVMKFFPNILSKEESLNLADRITSKIDERGWGLWAAEIKSSAEFIGFVGLSEQSVGLSIDPFIEIGWRLKKSAWGHGYATEGARAALEFGLQKFEVIYSMTSVINIKSRAVMERIGLVEREELAFDHPRVSEEALKPHVMYSTRY